MKCLFLEFVSQRTRKHYQKTLTFFTTGKLCKTLEQFQQQRVLHFSKTVSKVKHKCRGKITSITSTFLLQQTSIPWRRLCLRTALSFNWMRTQGRIVIQTSAHILQNWVMVKCIPWLDGWRDCLLLQMNMPPRAGLNTQLWQQRSATSYHIYRSLVNLHNLNTNR